VAIGKEDKKEEMKKQFSRLSKPDQQKAELEYHRMKPGQLDYALAKGTHHSPGTIRLSPRLVERLKAFATNEGEPEYQTMVRRWVEQRLRQEAKRIRKPARRRVSVKLNSV
jgi:hypothetical protein